MEFKEALMNQCSFNLHQILKFYKFIRNSWMKTKEMGFYSWKRGLQVQRLNNMRTIKGIVILMINHTSNFLKLFMHLLLKLVVSCVDIVPLKINMLTQLLLSPLQVPSLTSFITKSIPWILHLVMVIRNLSIQLKSLGMKTFCHVH